MNKIFVLTGAKNSGKSTRLMKWSMYQKDVAGIICLRKNKKKKLYSIHSNQFKNHEVKTKTESVISIGQFNFSQESFDWAEQEILKALEIKPAWLILDEIGPIELQGMGHDKIIKQIFSYPELSSTKLLLVIRENLVNEVIAYYNIDRAKINIIDFI